MTIGLLFQIWVVFVITISFCLALVVEIRPLQYIGRFLSAMIELQHRKRVTEQSETNQHPTTGSGSVKLPTPQKQSNSDQLESTSTLGYFDPDERRRDRFDEGVSVIGKDYYYHHLPSFLDRVMQFSKINGEVTACRKLSVSLRGSAQVWYNELDFPQLFHLSQGISNWIDSLTDRFKLPQEVAEAFLREEVYNTEDIQRRRSVAKYVSSITRYGLAANLEMHEVVQWAYTGLTRVFRGDIPKPDQHTTLEELLRQLKQLEPVWQKQYLPVAVNETIVLPGQTTAPSSSDGLNLKSLPAEKPNAIDNIVRQIGLEAVNWHQDVDLPDFLDKTVRALILQYNIKEVREAIRAAWERQVTRLMGDEELDGIATYPSGNGSFDQDEQASQSTYMITPGTSTTS